MKKLYFIKDVEKLKMELFKKMLPGQKVIEEDLAKLAYELPGIVDKVGSLPIPIEL